MAVLFVYNSNYIHLYLQKMEDDLENKENHKMILEQLYQNELIEEVDSLIALFSELTLLGANIAFRRFSGKGEIPGILDTLKKHQQDVHFVPLKIVLEENVDLSQYSIIISPLSMQNIPELYDLAFEVKIPVFPYTMPDWQSKCITRIVFSEVSLPFVYIPDSKNITENMIKQIKSKFRSNNFDYVIIKENEGFHSGIAVPYYHGPLDQLEDLLSNYESRTLQLIIEPFIIDQVGDSDNFGNELIKIHAFGEIVKTEVLHYQLNFKELQGKFGEETVKDMKRETWDTLPKNFPLEETNNLIKKYFPYNMTSLDFIYNRQSDQWECMDINHSAGSWGEVQEHGGTVSYTIFDQFVEKILDEDFITYNKTINNLPEILPNHSSDSFYMTNKGIKESLEGNI